VTSVGEDHVQGAEGLYRPSGCVGHSVLVGHVGRQSQRTGTEGVGDVLEPGGLEVDQGDVRASIGQGLGAGGADAAAGSGDQDGAARKSELGCA
jgi:hypothetical protein